MYCPNCGENISKKVNFCPNCGLNIKEFLEQEELEKRKKDEEKFENIFEKASQSKYQQNHDKKDISDIFEVVDSPNIENTSEHTIVFRNANYRPSEQKKAPEEKEFQEEIQESPAEENEVFITKGYEESVKKKKIREDIEFTNEKQFTINFETSPESFQNQNLEKEQKNWGKTFQQIARKTDIVCSQLMQKIHAGIHVAVMAMQDNKAIRMAGLAMIVIFSLFPIFMYMKNFTIGMPTLRLIMLYVAMLILFVLEVVWTLAINSVSFRALQYFNEVTMSEVQRRSQSILLSIVISLLFFGVYFITKEPVGIVSSVITANFFGDHAIYYVVILLANIFLLICSVWMNDRKILLKRSATILVSVVVAATILYLISATVIRTILYQFANVIF